MSYIELMIVGKSIACFPVGKFAVKPGETGGSVISYNGEEILVDQSYEYILKMISHSCPVFRLPESYDY